MRFAATINDKKGRLYLVGPNFRQLLDLYDTPEDARREAERRNAHRQSILGRDDVWRYDAVLPSTMVAVSVSPDGPLLVLAEYEDCTARLTAYCRIRFGHDHHTNAIVNEVWHAYGKIQRPLKYRPDVYWYSLARQLCEGLLGNCRSVSTGVLG